MYWDEIEIDDGSDGLDFIVCNNDWDCFLYFYVRIS